MSHAKHNDRDKVRLFSQAMQDRIDERLSTLWGLHQALTPAWNDEYRVNIKSGHSRRQF